MPVVNSLLAASRRDEFFSQSRRETRPFGTPLKGILIAILLVAARASAGTITVSIPADLHIEKAIATTEKEPKTTVNAKILDRTIIIENPIVGSAYEIQITLKDGTVLQGVDMGWYSRVPDKANAEPLTDDDRDQMKGIFTAGAQFFNVQQATLIQGNHNRAVMLVRLERDSAFHSDKGDEVIWRPELWYLENHHGGWEKTQQTDRVLRRERFATHAAYHAVVDKLKWVPELGGLKITPKNPDLKVTLPPNAGIATTPARPASQPAGASPPAP